MNNLYGWTHNGEGEREAGIRMVEGLQAAFCDRDTGFIPGLLLRMPQQDSSIHRLSSPIAQSREISVITSSNASSPILYKNRYDYLRTSRHLPSIIDDR